MADKDKSEFDEIREELLPKAPPLEEFRVNAPTWLAWLVVIFVGGLVVYCGIYELRHLPNQQMKQKTEPEILDFRPLDWIPNKPPKWYLEEKAKEAQTSSEQQNVKNSKGEEPSQPASPEGGTK